MIPIKKWKDIPMYFNSLEEEQNFYQTHEFSEAMKKSKFKNLKISKNPIRHFFREEKRGVTMEKKLGYEECIQLIEQNLSKIFAFYNKKEKTEFVIDNRDNVYEGRIGASLILFDLIFEKSILKEKNSKQIDTLLPFAKLYYLTLLYKTKAEPEFCTLSYIELLNRIYFRIYFEDIHGHTDLIEYLEYNKLTNKLERTNMQFVEPNNLNKEIK